LKVGLTGNGAIKHIQITQFGKKKLDFSMTFQSL